eukprot:3570183-Pleurochrysis_carterae.AAC.1
MATPPKLEHAVHVEQMSLLEAGNFDDVQKQVGTARGMDNGHRRRKMCQSWTGSEISRHSEGTAEQMKTRSSRRPKSKTGNGDEESDCGRGGSLSQRHDENRRASQKKERGSRSERRTVAVKRRKNERKRGNQGVSEAGLEGGNGQCAGKKQEEGKR